MVKIVKIKHGEELPKNGKYLNTETVKELIETTDIWRPTPGIMGSIPIFGTETQYRVRTYENVTYHYYEVEE